MFEYYLQIRQIQILFWVHLMKSSCWLWVANGNWPSSKVPLEVFLEDDPNFDASGYGSPIWGTVEWFHTCVETLRINSYLCIKGIMTMFMPY